MSTTLFQWISDTDGDGVVSDESARYETTFWLPEVSPPDGGRQQTLATLPTLDGEALVLCQGRAGAADGRAPGRFTLKWEIADADLLRLAEEDYAKGRLVQVRLDHRWRQLEVVSAGTADRKVTVAAGYLLDHGDTCWLAADAVHACGATHTVVYATPAAGAVTIASGASVPTGSVALATISIAGDIVTVLTSPSGVANARQGYITAFETTPMGAGLSGLSLTMQEVR